MLYLLSGFLQRFVYHEKAQKKSICNALVTISLSVVWKIPYFGLPKYPILQHQNTLYCTTNIGCFAFAFHNSLFLVLIFHYILPYPHLTLFSRFMLVFSKVAVDYVKANIRGKCKKI